MSSWVLVAALALPAPAAAAPPREGILVPGQSLGGIRLGMTKAQVKARWGHRFGRCRTCLFETWYFNYRPFEPQGTAVEFELGTVRRAYTVWQPPGWKTSNGLQLGADESEVTARYGKLPRQQCRRSEALLKAGPGTVTVLYLYDGELWGFGLMRPGLAACV